MSRMDDQSTQGREQGAATGQLRDQASQVGQQIKDLGSQARTAATEQVGQIKDQAGQYYEQGRDAAQQYYDQGREKAMEWEQGLEDYVRQQPVKAVLMAAGIGLVFGFLWRRS